MSTKYEPRVRETSDVAGTGNIPLRGKMGGSLAFGEICANGDDGYICISYGDMFEECAFTYVSASNELQRGAVVRSRHANGTVDQTHVSFPVGSVSTVILVYPSNKIALLETDVLRKTTQTFTSPEKRQIQDNIGFFETGVEMLFHQTTAPVGWTKQTTHNDKLLKLTSGTVGGGGSVAFSTLFARTATDLFTILQGNLPSFTLPDTLGVSDTRGWATVNAIKHFNNVGPFTQGGGTTEAVQATQTVQVVSGSISKTGSTTSGGSGTSLSAGLDMRVQYREMIIARKD